ncbi:MAG: FAD-linked oxidase C-terminal domain-containing protein [Nocardioidaceae bacterium]
MGLPPVTASMHPDAGGELVAQWDEIKSSASEAIIANGGTITHHHAVGATIARRARRAP